MERRGTESLAQLFRIFLGHGLVAWGGPVAQIARMHAEFVERRAWVSEERFRKTLALYQALPGPEATELAVFFGMVRRGRWGASLAGLGFILPGLVFVTALATLYVGGVVDHGWVEVALYGVRPAVLALLLLSFLRLMRASVTHVSHGVIAIASAAVGFVYGEVNILWIIGGGGLAGLAWSRLRRTENGRGPPSHHAWIPLALATPFFLAGAMPALVLLSLKVGLLTFGGAYTSIPFLHRGAVVEQHWLSEDGFLDAVGLSSLAPGPLISVGAFVGYAAAGFWGAVAASVVIFLPAFGFTLLGHEYFERIVHEPRLHAFLLGVTAAVVGLIASSAFALGRSAFVDLVSWALFVAAGVLLWRRVPSPIVLALAGAAGALVRLWP